MILLRLLPKTTSTIPTVIAWIIAVNFAYVVNRKWVFQIQSKSIRALFREAASFYLARIFSLLLAVIIMWLLVDFLRYNADIIKLASNVLVVVINYLSSKFWVFRRGDDPHKRQKLQ
jgi:putative flippase GtrA